MKLAAKITLSASCGVILSTLGAITTVYAISHSNRVDELRALMSSTLQQAETVTGNVDALHQSGAFDLRALRNSLKQAQGKDFRSTVFIELFRWRRGGRRCGRSLKPEVSSFIHRRGPALWRAILKITARSSEQPSRPLPAARASKSSMRLRFRPISWR